MYKGKRREVIYEPSSPLRRPGGADRARKYTQIAKINRPVLTGIFPRTRLFQHLESSRDRPIIWVTGPPGCGKTTLIASYLDSYKIPSLWYNVDEGDADIATFFYYIGLAAKKAAPHKRKPLPLLTPEYLLGIPTFTLRFFDELYSRLKTPFAIVIDNYQQVPSESKFHDVIKDALSVIPEKINVILISRGNLPQQLVRLQANNKISFMGWNEIRFSLDETREIVQMRRRKNLTDEMLLQLHKKTDGWAAGLILMLEMAKIKGIDYQLMDKIIPEEIFAYFASEIFYKTDRETQDFLLKTAFLPQINHHIAEKLTGNPQASRILFDLNQKNYFTQKYVLQKEFYQYHPLFREFLLTKAKDSLEPSILAETKKKAATFLEADGQIEDAVTLLSDVKDWEGLIRLILSHSQSLIAQGRFNTLKEWIVSIPENIVENTAWLLYWLGVCRMPFNPAEGELHFENAYSLFKKQKDTAGIFLAWSGIIYSIAYEFRDYKKFDQWISELDELLREYKSFPSGEIEARVATTMLSALVLRQPQHPDFEIWTERALSLSQNSEDINLKVDTLVTLGSHRIFSGDFKKASHVINSFREVIKSGNVTLSTLLTLKDIEVFYYWSTGMFEECHKTATEGLELASATGAHFVDHMLSGHGAAGSLSAGDMATAKRFIQKMASCLGSGREWEKSFYHMLSTWVALLQKDLPQASLHAELALNFSIDAGMPTTEACHNLGMALVMHELGKQKEAERHIAEAHTIGRFVKSQFTEFMCLLAEAQFAFDSGDEESGIDFLRRAMTLGREQGYVNTFFWRPSVMAKLCLKALEAGIEVKYVQNLIRKRNLIPDSPSIECENWPWPLKIYTFGRFGITKDEKPVHFSGKIQHKPLLLLKALIALGGREIAETRLADIIWPEAEGDAAHNSFTTTLSRLRQLLGIENAIKFYDGKATLDPRYCWIDVWVFERLVGRTEELWKQSQSKPSTEEAIRLTEKAIAMYRGPFLPADDKYWAFFCRERLRSKFLRLITKIGKYQEQTGQCEKAVEYYQKALEVDNLVEEFYQRLMVCYQHLGQQAEAMKVYKRCHNVLSTVLGIEPSSKTEAIYKSLKL